MTNETQTTQPEKQPSDVVADYFKTVDAVVAKRAAVDEDLKELVQAYETAQKMATEAALILENARHTHQAWADANAAQESAQTQRETILALWTQWFPGTQTPPGLGIQRRTTHGILVRDAHRLYAELEGKGLAKAAVDEAKLAKVFTTKFVRQILDADVTMEGVSKSDTHTLADVRRTTAATRAGAPAADGEA